MALQIENLQMRKAKSSLNEKLANYYSQPRKKYFAVIGKGGTGKTTIAVELSRVLTDIGETMCVGIDRQNNHADLIEMKNYKIKYNVLTNKINKIFNQMIEFSFLKGFQDFIPLLAPDFLTISELAELLNNVDDVFDNVVIDMPPNTQGLSMLNMPDAMENMTFKTLTLKNRLRKKIKGSDPGLDAAKYLHDIILDLREKIKSTNWIAIGIPTELGFIETVRSVEYLQKFGYKVYSIIVNMVQLDNPDKCSICKKKIKKNSKIIDKFKKYSKKSNIPLLVMPYTFDDDQIKNQLETMIETNKLAENSFSRGFEEKGIIEKIPNFILNGIIKKDSVFFKNSKLIIKIKNRITCIKLEKEDIMKIFKTEFKFGIDDDIIFSNQDKEFKNKIELRWNDIVIDFKSLESLKSIEFNLNDDIELSIPIPNELQIGKKYNITLEFFFKKIFRLNLSRMIN